MRELTVNEQEAIDGGGAWQDFWIGFGIGFTFGMLC